VSSCHRACLEHAEEVAGEVALEATDRLAHAFALAGLALDVADRRRVVLAAADDDRVQRAVELPVAAGVESVAADAAGGGRDRGGAGEAGEGGLRAEAPAV
jgi:hypothetical protein